MKSPVAPFPRPTALHPVLEQAVDFTNTYLEHRESPPAVREAACLRVQFPARLAPIDPDDLFAGGHLRNHIAYVGSMWWATMPNERGPGKQGGFCFDFGADQKYDFSHNDQETYEELKAFWRKEVTWAKIRNSWDDEMDALIRNDGQILGGGCGFVLAMDLDRLLQLGIQGLERKVSARIERARSEGCEDEVVFLQSAKETLDLFRDICRYYSSQALEQAKQSATNEDRDRLQRISDSLEAILQRPPATLHEAIQLWWLYTVVASGLHIEGWQMDVALGDFYTAAIDEHGMSEAEAIELVKGLWRMFAKHGDPAVCRVVVGGRGRRNVENANRFCLGAMEAHRQLKQVIPQLTLRFHREQDPALLKRAYDVLGEGCTFPMLYNDDVNVPGVAKALRVPLADADRYHPLGCGEYMIGGASPSLLNVAWSIPRTLELAMRGGVNVEGRRAGIEGPREFELFDQLWDAFVAQTAHAADLAARVIFRNNAVLPNEVAYLLGSLLMDDCVERGRSIMDDGARYIGACTMAHGFTNAADSLVAIRKLVFDLGLVNWNELVDALDKNFEGHAALKQRLAAMPKFGNDDPDTDQILADMWREISRLADEAGIRYGLHFHTVSSVNPGGYHLGQMCPATADGRPAGEPFAIGNAPTAGADTSGLTAMMNSVSKVDAANGGATTSVKLAKSLFQQSRPKLEALMSAYWKRGGMQATLTVVDQADLEDAMEHPDKYPHLLVRVGGWTARFIDLEEPVQREIIRRTLY